MEILPDMYELVSYNKFIVLRLEDDVLQNISVFKASREINNVCNCAPKIHPQDDGTLLLEFSTAQSGKLLKMNTLVGRKVTCFPNPIHNQSRGVIYAPELLLSETKEIQQELDEQNVAKVVSTRKKVGDQTVPLAKLILTFNTFKLPNGIKAGWLNFKVKPYIPSPMRCYHCQIFGHLIQKYRKKINEEPALCCNWGKEAHGPCNEPPSCINCGENYPASSKSCVKFILEKEVQTVKVMEKILFIDARKKILELQIRPGVTFSSVIKKPKSSAQVPATHAVQQKPSPPVTKSNQAETTPRGEEHGDDKPQAGCSLNNQNSTSLQQPNPQVLKSCTVEIPKGI
ncbi:uncharacterized protein LOC135213274 [Macrobrachium nipponense]|uniref:uncharacterized protein LOC135213274 n=1 Tax=Macrobrachium nipponense TaxID=159736 RepID=UPI0030C8A264